MRVGPQEEIQSYPENYPDWTQQTAPEVLQLWQAQLRKNPDQPALIVDLDATLFDSDAAFFDALLRMLSWFPNGRTESLPTLEAFITDPHAMQKLQSWLGGDLEYMRGYLDRRQQNRTFNRCHRLMDDKLPGRLTRLAQQANFLGGLTARPDVDHVRTATWDACVASGLAPAMAGASIMFHDGDSTQRNDWKLAQLQHLVAVQQEVRPDSQQRATTPLIMIDDGAALALKVEKRNAQAVFEFQGECWPPILHILYIEGKQALYGAQAAEVLELTRRQDLANHGVHIAQTWDEVEEIIDYDLARRQEYAQSFARR